MDIGLGYIGFARVGWVIPSGFKWRDDFMRKMQSVTVVLPNNRFDRLMKVLGRLREIEKAQVLRFSVNAKFGKTDTKSMEYDVLMLGISHLGKRVEIDFRLGKGGVTGEGFAKGEAMLEGLATALEGVVGDGAVARVRTALDGLEAGSGMPLV